MAKFIYFGQILGFPQNFHLLIRKSVENVARQKTRQRADRQFALALGREAAQVGAFVQFVLQVLREQRVDAELAGFVLAVWILRFSFLAVFDFVIDKNQIFFCKLKMKKRYLKKLNSAIFLFKKIDKN